MCRIGMRVDRQVLSHEWIIMDTNITGREKERGGGEERREGKKEKRFSYNSYFHLAFYKIYSLIQM